VTLLLDPVSRRALAAMAFVLVGFLCHFRHGLLGAIPLLVFGVVFMP